MEAFLPGPELPKHARKVIVCIAAVILFVYLLTTPRNTTFKAFGYTYTFWVTKNKSL